MNDRAHSGLLRVDPVPIFRPMIRPLLDRRVPQFVLLYLAGGWGFLEFLDWAVTRYVLSPSVIDFAVALLVLFLPSVIVIAWRHGAPGADEWKLVDAAAIGVNVLVAAVALFVMFRDAELGAATTVKLVEDTEGNTIERVVPKAGFRRSVLGFDFENETGDEELDWLEFGIPLAVAMDLAQDVFVTQTGSHEPAIREFLAEHGVQPGEEVPLSLKRDAAQLRGMEHFFAGSIDRGGDGGPRVHTSLYQTRTGRVVASHEYEMRDARDVADRISLDLRKDLGIPDGQIEQSVDLPAEELLTESAEAFRLTSEAQRELVNENNPAAARRLAERALSIDSTNAMAHLVVTNAALFSGDQAAAGAAVGEAIRYAYRLPERFRLALQVQNEYLFEGDHEAAMRAGRYWTEIYPEDIEARRLLANIYAGSGDTGNAAQQLRALLAIDSTDATAMRQLAGALAAEAEYDSALAWYDRMVDRRPGDVDVRLDRARTLTAAGRFDAAREALGEAAVVAPRDADVPRELAYLDLRAGDIEAAERRLAEVEELERTPTERVNRIALEESLAYARGEFDRLEDAYRRRLATLSENQSPLAVVAQIDNSEYLLFAAEAGRGAEALAQIDSLKSLVQEPWSLLMEFPALRNHIERGDAGAARSALEGLERWLAFAGASEHSRASVAWAQGRIAALEDGDCRRALPLYEQATEADERSGLYRVTRLACLTELERWPEAGREASWVIERYPGRPTYRLAVARYEAARGRTAEALAHLEYVLVVWENADAGYLPAQQARALWERLQG